MARSQYKALADRLSEQIHKGVIHPGTKLLPHRKYAEQMNISLGTATRVYRELVSRGLVVGEVGRGVFVRDQGIPLTLGIEQRVADGLIDLVFNMPNSEGDSDLLRAALKRIAISGDLDAILLYQPHAGRPHERAIIAAHLKDRIGKIEPQTLLVVSGAQHGLSLIMTGLLKKGDTVATDYLTYAGFKSIASLSGINLVPITHLNGSLDPDDLDRVCTMQRVRALYAMPTVQNPIGSVMDERTRRCVTEIARRHDLLVIEDSAYAFLETNPPPSFFELMPERTIYVGGFSKNIATGLRLGYLVSPGIYLDTLIRGIRATTWNAPALISSLVTGWIEDGTLRLFEARRRADGARRQGLCRKLLWNAEIVAHQNAGFAWIPMPNGVRVEPIIKRLIERGYAVSGGDPFAISDNVPQALRIAFGGVKDSSLREALICIRMELQAALRKLGPAGQSQVRSDGLV